VYSQVDTTICDLISTKDSVQLHFCVRIQGKSKSDFFSAVFFIKEYGENKIMYKDDIASFVEGEESMWNSQTLEMNCPNPEECRWLFIKKGMLIHSTLNEEPNKLQSELKKQLLSHLATNARLNKQEAE
jgi:hypothetical protein